MSTYIDIKSNKDVDIKSNTDVLFVFDEIRKEAVCCRISKEDKKNYPNQIYSAEECIIVKNDITECENILNRM